MFELRKESPCFSTSAEHMALPLERRIEMVDECIRLANKCTMLRGQLAMFHVHVFFFFAASLIPKHTVIVRLHKTVLFCLYVCFM